MTRLDGICFQEWYCLNVYLNAHIREETESTSKPETRKQKYLQEHSEENLETNPCGILKEFLMYFLSYCQSIGKFSSKEAEQIYLEIT